MPTAQAAAYRQAHWAVALAVVGVLAAAPLLVPDSAQLGAHLYGDRQTKQAQAYLERALADRGPVREVALPLAQIYAQAGNHSAALALLQRLEPAQETAAERDLRRSALKQTGRTFEYVRELRRAEDREATAERARELAELYGQRQMLELQAAALARVLELQPDDRIAARQLGHLRLQLGDQAGAYQIMRRVWLEEPAALTPADRALLLETAVQVGTGQDALRLASALSPADAAHAATVFFRAGRFAEVRALLDAQVLAGRADAAAVAVWARALAALGQVGEAVAALRSRSAAGAALDSQVAGVLCSALVDQGDRESALELAERMRFLGLPAPVLVALANAVAAAGDVATLRQILPKLPRAALERDPVSALHLFAVAQDRSEALRWAQIAMDREDLVPAQRLWLAELQLAMGKPAAAAVSLQTYGAQAMPTDDNALRTSLLFWRANSPAKGLMWLAKAENRRTPALLASRALLMSQNGQPAEALQFAEELAQGGLQRRGIALLREWLQALAAAAAQHNYPQLGVFAFHQLLGEFGAQRPWQLALAQSLAAAGQRGEALAALRALPQPLSASELALQRQMLADAWRTGLPVKDELVQVAVAYLQSTDLYSADAKSWVHLLIDMGEERTALPYVALLALKLRGPWAALHIELLTKLGQSAEVAALWRQKGLDATLPEKERLEAAAQLVATDRPTALRILQELAANAEPDSAIVKQLLYLWGPRPGAAAEAWLAARAKAATGAAQVQWCRHLLWVGAAEQVAVVIDAGSAVGPALDVLIDALVAAKQGKALAAMAEKRARDLQDVGQLRRLAELCAGHGQRKAAELAYGRLLELQPADAPTLRWLAQSAAGSPIKALKYWQAYFALPAEQIKAHTWRDRAAYGDLLLNDAAHQQDGKAQLQIALRMLADADLPAHVRDRESGRLLGRMGRTAESIAPLERALLAEPCDDALRADLVAALMATQQFDRARALVDPPAKCTGGK